MRQRISPLWLVAMLGIVATGFQFDFWSMRSLDKAVGWTATARTELAERRREEAALVTLVAGFPGPVVSSNMMILRLANKPIPFEPAIINQTTRTGAFNEEELVQRTANRYFDAFVTPKIAEGFFSRRMLQTILQNYQPYPFRGADYVVYVRQAR
jgi:hypothetical protein